MTQVFGNFFGSAVGFWKIRKEHQKLKENRQSVQIRLLKDRVRVLEKIALDKFEIPFTKEERDKQQYILGFQVCFDVLFIFALIAICVSVFTFYLVDYIAEAVDPPFETSIRAINFDDDYAIPQVILCPTVGLDMDIDGVDSMYFLWGPPYFTFITKGDKNGIYFPMDEESYEEWDPFYNMTVTGSHWDWMNPGEDEDVATNCYVTAPGLKPNFTSTMQETDSSFDFENLDEFTIQAAFDIDIIYTNDSLLWKDYVWKFVGLSVQDSLKRKFPDTYQSMTKEEKAKEYFFVDYGASQIADDDPGYDYYGDHDYDYCWDFDDDVYYEYCDYYWDYCCDYYFYGVVDEDDGSVVNSQLYSVEYYRFFNELDYGKYKGEALEKKRRYSTVQKNFLGFEDTIDYDVDLTMVSSGEQTCTGNSCPYDIIISIKFETKQEITEEAMEKSWTDPLTNLGGIISLMGGAFLVGNLLTKGVANICFKCKSKLARKKGVTDSDSETGGDNNRDGVVDESKNSVELEAMQKVDDDFKQTFVETKTVDGSEVELDSTNVEEENVEKEVIVQTPQISTVIDAENRSTDTEEGDQRKQELFEVKFDYSPTSDDELSIAKGDVIILKERTEDEWWLGKVRGSGKEGLFPRKFVVSFEEPNQEEKEKVKDEEENHLEKITIGHDDVI